MKSNAKTTLVYAAGVALAITATVGADAAQTQQNFPTKPVRLIVPNSAGGATDTLARRIGAQMSQGWGQPVVVDSRPGAGGALATNIVAKAAPDGYTLLLTASFAISAALQPNLPYDPLKDFTGVSRIGSGTVVLLVAPALNVKSVKDLISLAKAQPGKLIYGSSAVGTSVHLSGARFNQVAGIKVITVAFKGGPEAIIEVLAGRTSYSFVALTPALPFIKDGKLLALAVSTEQRIRALPDVPTLGEALPEFKRRSISFGLQAPAGTPRPILNKISKEVARILDLPDIKEWLHTVGIVAAPSTPEEYDRVLREEIEMISATARDLGLQTR